MIEEDLGDMSRNKLQHWRARAAKFRALAATAGNPNVATLMMDLAAEYEQLAAAVEVIGQQRLSTEQPESSREQRAIS